MAVSPDNTGLTDSLLRYIFDVKIWMSQDFLQFNQNKTEILVIGSKAQREKLVSVSMKPWCGLQFKSEL